MSGVQDLRELMARLEDVTAERDEARRRNAEVRTEILSCADLMTLANALRHLIASQLDAVDRQDTAEQIDDRAKVRERIAELRASEDLVIREIQRRLARLDTEPRPLGAK